VTVLVPAKSSLAFQGILCDIECGYMPRKNPDEVWRRPEKLGPDSTDARDEGPRLIPFADTVIPALPDHNRYLALADEALAPKPKARSQKAKG
jgi:hypothetical protein